MEIPALKVTTRESSGTSRARKTRAQGSVPGILYGGGQAPLSVSLNAHEFALLTHRGRGEHAVVRLEFDDDPAATTPALIKEVQHHALRGDFLHVDFQRIRLDERIATQVSVRLVGQAPGIVEGGVLDHQLRDLEVECLALEVPEEIVVDISGLQIGDSIHVNLLQVPENVTVLTDPDRPVVTIHAPRLVKEEVAEAAEGAEGAEPTEPEVISERKEREKEAED